MLRRLLCGTVMIALTACSSGGEDSAAPGTPPPASPSSGTSSAAPSISTTRITAKVGVPISAKIAASDPNGDAITLSLLAAPEWLSMRTDGSLSGTPSEADIGQHEIDLEASDGTETTRATIPLVVDFDAVEMALRIGDYTIIEEETDQTPAELLKAVVSEIEQQNNADIIELLGLNAAGELTDHSFDNINWGLHPVDTSRLTPTFGRSAPFLRGIGRLGARDIPQTVSVLGRYLSGRFMVFGNNPLSGTFDDTNDRHLLMKRSLHWLSDTAPGSELNIMIAHVKGDRENDQSRMKDWLDGAFGTEVSYNQDGACNGSRFEPCLTDNPDLIIIYQNVNSDLEADTLLGMIEEALANGIGILHVHRQTHGHRTAFGGRLLNLFGVTQNGSVVHRARVSGAQPLGDLLNWRPGFVQSAVRLIDGITDQSYDYDLSVCSGPVQCRESNAFHNEAYRDIANLRNFLLEMARRNVTPFPANDTNRFIGALLLAGDYFRSQTAYPMPKQTTPSSDIVRALFGEAAN
ncbi:MAG: putative Ig domain-containing protein, partial [Pseudomonadota bacterium]